MPESRKVLSPLLNARRTQLLPLVAGLVALIAVADWAVGNRMSLGVLYVLPMMLGAVVLSPVQILLLALLCSSLRSCFDLPSPYVEMLLRFIFAVISYLACGLMVAGLIRNRQVALEHLARIRQEQILRKDAEEQLRTLAESSPAAILTLDAKGVVIAANKAAHQIFGLPESESFKGKAIAHYLPVLADALQVGLSPGSTDSGTPVGLRAAAQCQGRRDNGEIFLANTWFSSYAVDSSYRLAAIVVDSSEEMREHEEENSRQLLRGNLIAAAAVSHEVRNLCSAISVVSLNLREKHGLAPDEEFRALESLVHGLEKVASIGLRSGDLHAGVSAADDVQNLPLQAVLDDLRIVIESDWHDMGGSIQWSGPPVSPVILADRHGLLQVFLNLARNSHRAVLNRPVRNLAVSVDARERTAIVRFQDSGPGLASPAHLFEPFQPGADGTGLGLYVSRTVVRGYGGELRYEPTPAGSCFAVELQIVPAESRA